MTNPHSASGRREPPGQFPASKKFNRTGKLTLPARQEEPMPLDRILEPEVMDSPEEANDYDAMDHAAVNQVFVDELLAALSLAPSPQPPAPLDILDLGSGTGLIPVELCR